MFEKQKPKTGYTIVPDEFANFTLPRLLPDRWLDRLIARVRAAEDPQAADPLGRRLRVLVAEGRISPALARELRDLHHSTNKGRDES